MSSLLITMSGGTTSVINATLVGLVEEAQRSNRFDKIWAGFPGINGVMSGELIDLTTSTRETLTRLYHSPGSASIGTTRIEILSKEKLDHLKSIFDELNVECFVNIGGNGTIKQTKAIADHIPDVQIAAAPKTVDNDLGDSEFKQLWYTPGFPSCVNYWYNKMHMINNENIGACSHDKVLIAQTFGRETGFIAGSVRLYDPNRELPLVLLLPEDQRDPDCVINKIKDVVDTHGRAVVVMSEGYKISDYTFAMDRSGQPMYGSSRSTNCQELVNLCMDNGIQSRGYNPTIDQRQNFEHTLPEDLRVSKQVGSEIIKNFSQGHSHFFQSIRRNPIAFERVSLSDISNYSRTMLDKWICDWDVTDDYVDYLREFVSPTEPRSLFVGGV